MFSNLSSCVHSMRGLLVALVIAISSSACSTEAKKARHLKRGEEYLAEGKQREAIIEFLNVIQLDENDRVATQRLAVTLYETGQLGPAFRYLQRAAEFDPDDTDIRVKLATIYLYSGQREQAREEAGAVLENESGNLDALTIFADSAATPGEIDGAMLRLDGARDEHEGRARYHLARGMLHIKKQEIEEAEAAFQEAARREPDSPDAHLGLGNFYLLTRDLEKAESEFDQAAELAPTRSEAQIRVVDFYRLLGRTEEANEKLDRLVEDAPDFLPAWQRIASYSFGDEDFDRCEKALNHLLESNPKNPEALQLMANVHRLRGENEEATERFREAIAVLQDIVQRRPGVASAQLRLAQMHIRLGETEQARTALQTIRELAPNSAAATILLAELNVRTGRYGDALPTLEDLARTQPSLAVFDLLGQAYTGEQRYQEATAAFRAFAEAAPRNRRAHFLFGRSLVAEGKVEEGKTHFRESLRLDPAYVEPLNMLATLEAQQGRLGRALDTVQRQIEQIAPTGGHYFSLGQLYLASNQLNHAETALLKAIELQPDLNAAYGQLTAIFVADNRADEALISLQRGLERDPDNLSIMMLKGSVQHVTNNLGAAQDTYEELLGVSPRFAPAANNLAYIYQEQEGMLEKALELAEVARAEAQDNPDIADTLGWILYKRGSYERALGLLAEAAAGRPDNAEILYHLGFAHYRQGEFQECAEAFNKAMELDPASPLAEEAGTILLELR